MDQLKDFLKLMINYRFWIAVVISAILPGVAYVLGAGPIQQKAAEEEAKIKGAAEGVKKYAMGTPITQPYASLVQEKTAEVSKEVETSWKKLYERQAPLLTWPERVQDRFTTWGRQWPKDVDPSQVQFAILDYITEYPKFVSEVYKSIRPFDYAEGTGVVATPGEQVLLKPSPLMVETAPPSLGKVWAAQEKLWIQRTMLDVVAKVNADAKDWDSAIIKQINALEVGNKAAQDQRSVAKADKLVESPDIVDPNAPPPATTAAAGAEAAAPGGAPGAPGGTPGAEAIENPDAIYYIGSPDGAFKILPAMISVLIDQDHIQDFLIALENSPMTIQVRDFELSKPTARVEKPKQGVAPAFAGMMGNFGGMLPSNSGMTIFGAPGSSGGPGSMAMPMEMNIGTNAPGSSGGPGSLMGGPVAPQRKGVDVRGVDPRKLREEQRKAAMKTEGPVLHDPYYNIVEVKVYGQARFFNHPPAPAATEPSQAATAPAPGASPATPAPADGTATAPAPGTSPASATPAPAEGTPPAEKKADEPAKAEEKKADEPKAEGKKADEPAKAEEKKAEAPAPK